jgi:hypothetical protein
MERTCQPKARSLVGRLATALRTERMVSAHLSHLLIRLVERQRVKPRKQDLVEAIFGIGLEQWHQDAHAVGGKMLLFHHCLFALRGMVEEGGRAQGKIEHEFLVGRNQTFKGQVEQRFLMALASLRFMLRVIHTQRS